MSSAPAETQNPPVENFLATVLPSMLTQNCNMGLIQAYTAAHMINYQEMCANAHFQ